MSVVSFSEEVCVICNKFDDGKLTCLGTKGLQGLSESSVLGGFSELIDYLNSKPNIVRVHEKCRRDFTNKRRLQPPSIDESTSDESVRCKFMRSSSTNFDWKIQCFLCCKNASVDERHPDRNKISKVSTLSIRSSILKVCLERCDEWAFAVRGRIETEEPFAAEAVYHRVCLTKFYGKSKLTPDDSVKKQGRVVDSKVLENFNLLCSVIDDNDCELYSLNELHDKLKDLADDPDNVYCEKQLKRKLQQNDQWYADRKTDAASESERIVLKAAELIKASIREMLCDTSVYPSSHKIGDRQHVEQWVPGLLQTFLGKLINDDLKQIAVGHSIVQACRPRSVISPVLFGIGLFMDHTLGSTRGTNLLSRLGFSVTSDEVTRFKQSVVQRGEDELTMFNNTENVFVQWAADNVDHNVTTLDGLNTFHGMGVISMKSSLGQESLFDGHFCDVEIKRLQRVNVAKIVAGKGIPLERFAPPNEPILSKVYFKPMRELYNACTLPAAKNLDIMWHLGWFFSDENSPRTNWSGFMQDVYGDETSCAADIRMLPIINMNPGDRSCILSTLLFICKQSKLLNIEVPCVTFDQPLWLKAVEVGKAEMLNIVCRLGVFHVLMSFLGSLGNMMAGSGLSEALECCYGPNTVNQILGGKAVARAIRGHFLVDSALSVLFFKPVIEHVYSEQLPALEFTPADICIVKDLFVDLINRRVNVQDVSECESFVRMSVCMERLKCEFAANFRTAKLWLQYQKYIDVLKTVLRAERTGDWNLHLIGLTDMLNLFAATGHVNYARCLRLYLQMMVELPQTHPWLYERFVKYGCHSVRRTDRFWAGLSTDLVIEQVMMKSIKSRGGLTHGRGMSESARLTWTGSVHECASVVAAVSSLVGLDRSTSTVCHVDVTDSRRRRDFGDVCKLIEWFGDNNPFSNCDSRLRSLSSGIVVCDEDDVNCDEVDDVGYNVMMRLNEIAFADAVIKKSDHVKTFATLTKTVKCGKHNVAIDSSLLFNRLSVIVERTPDMRPYFTYELTTFPASLFKDGFMRKTDKSALAKELSKDVSTTRTPKFDLARTYVVDGGCLLHKVKWQQNGTFEDVAKQYVSFVHNHYGNNCVVVFDGYMNGPSIKNQEQERRSVASAPNIIVNAHTPVFRNQSDFLKNTNNKKSLIDFLITYLTNSGLAVHQARDDADTLIVSVAVHVAVNEPVVVVSDDTDVLVLLIFHFKPNYADIFQLSEITRVRQPKTVVYHVREIVDKLGSGLVQSLLVIHALSGCDSTSAFFGMGKKTVLKKIAANSRALKLSEVLSSCTSSKEEILDAGFELVVLLYSGSFSQSLNHTRYTTYMHLAATSKNRPRPEQLPPTERAVSFHILRVYLQVMQWKSLLTTKLNPSEWGWQLENNRYMPIHTDLEPAPADILNVVRCNCKPTLSAQKQCSSQVCSCRKHGLQCVAACKHYFGETCCNVASQQCTEVYDSDRDELVDAYDAYTLDDCTVFDNICADEEEVVTSV